MQLRQHFQHHPVAGGDGVIHGVLGADDQCLRVIGGVEIAARVIPEVTLQNLRPFLRPGQVKSLAGHLMEGEGGTRHIGVIIEQSRMHCPAKTVAVREAAVGFHGMGRQGDEGLLRRVDPMRLVKIMPGAGEGGDHQAVPVGQHLVIKAWPDPLLPRFKQLLAP